MERIQQLLADHKNTVVLTAGSSVSRILLEQYSATERKNGHSVWQCPPIYSFNMWLRTLWDQIPFSSDFSKPVLLSNTQEQAVWQSIISESKWSNVLMQVSLLARNAQQANRLMADWKIPPAKLNGFNDEESVAFRSWVKSFSDRCKENQWAEEHRLADLLIALPNGLIEWPLEIATYGLSSLTPQQQGFLDHLAQKGCKIVELNAEPANQSAVRIGVADSNSEYKYVASWVKRLLQDEQPTRIAIALTDYSKQVDSLTRALNRVLTPEQLYPSASDNLIYAVSHKTSLAEQALIDCALKLLSQSRHRVDLSEFSLIIRSIHISGANEEYSERSRFDAHLRSLGELTPSLTYICSKIFDKEKQQNNFDCPELLKRLHNWRKQIDALPKTQPASAWAASFTKILGAAGWATGVELSHDEGQIVARWDDVLSNLCGLDQVTPTMQFEDALRWLRNIVSNATVPTANRKASVHILSIDDAAALEFDHLWICGLDDNQWPPAVRPNPLLPVALQREYELPGASSNAVAQTAKQVIDDVLQHSRNIVLSYAVTEDDRELRACPLIESVDQISPDSLSLEFDPAIKIFESRLHELVEEQTLPMQTGKASGGTSILKNQAACPFRAFATHRLRSEIPEEPEPGLDASERGTLMHNILETVWLKLGSHSGLVEKGQAAREHIVAEATQNELEKMTWKKPETITPRFREIEQERLIKHVMTWLEKEEERESFTVLKPEAERKINLSGLEMNMRIDRIDQNEIGERVIIDYKTGKTSPASWFGERPDEPQVPLYALSEIELGNEIAALSFAQIRPGEFGFKGISNQKGQLPNVAGIEKHTQGKHFESWQALLADWRTKLEGIANDFVAGVAVVDPKSNKSCLYCELTGACRINELNQRLGLVEIESDGDE